jgi:glucose-6-phosphate 1-dehydrogenase
MQKKVSEIVIEFSELPFSIIPSGGRIITAIVS